MLQEIDPFKDLRWPEFLRSHPAASVFHTVGWLQALQRTYGHKPAALVATGIGGQLTGALVFCRLDSHLTGRRLISLPFSDHCGILSTDHVQAAELLTQFQETARAEGRQTIEIRPTSAALVVPDYWKPSQTFHLHRLDLRPGVTAVFEGFHKDCIRRRIRHAKKENVSVSEGRDPESVRQFYALLVKTRRRHGVPPQPLTWFENIIDFMGESASIYLARKNGITIAAIFALRYGRTLYYKYGASDARFHDLGGMPCLFWYAIETAIHSGLHELDMGRSDCNNPGLITFKERWGAKSSSLIYWTSILRRSKKLHKSQSLLSMARVACRHLPDRCLVNLGKVFYGHID